MDNKEIKELIEKQIGSNVSNFEIENIEGHDTAFFEVPMIPHSRMMIPNNFVVMTVNTIDQILDMHAKVSDILLNEEM